MRSRSVTPVWQDKALWVSVLSMFLPAISAKLGVQLDAAKIVGYIVPAVAFIVAHKWKSWSILSKEIEAGLLAKVTVDPPAPVPDNAVVSGAVKVTLFLCVLAIAGVGTSARAQPIISSGPTIPLMEIRPGNAHPVNLAAGAGYQVSLTLPQLQRAVGGKAWDLLDLNLMAFGTLVSSNSGEGFGAFSAALGLCTFSSLLCFGGGHDIITGPGQTSGWFALFALSLNFALGPYSPPIGVEQGPAGLQRANTLYF